MRLKLPAQPQAACQPECAGPEAPWAPDPPAGRKPEGAWPQPTPRRPLPTVRAPARALAPAGAQAGAAAGSRGCWHGRQPKTQHRSPGSRPRARARSQAQWAGRRPDGPDLSMPAPHRQVLCMTPARMHRRRDRCHSRTGRTSARAHHGTVARAMAMRVPFPWVSTHGPCRGFRANLKVRVGLLR
jgi:hypothetical protein